MRHHSNLQDDARQHPNLQDDANTQQCCATKRLKGRHKLPCTDVQAHLHQRASQQARRSVYKAHECWAHDLGASNHQRVPLNGGVKSLV
jgi:hypothetical protein